MTTRFRDRRQYLWCLSERVLVQCPRCKGRAVALRKGPRFACSACGNAQSPQRGSDSSPWAGMAKATVRRRCGWCGRRLSRTVRRGAPHPRKLRVVCPGCAHTNYFSVIWWPDPQDDPYDPYFGYRLWLQTRCGSRVLWAYNAEHLVFLRDYVEAGLRERESNANSTLASRLPRWLKEARNRESILRAAARLEAKLAEPQRS